MYRQTKKAISLILLCIEPHQIRTEIACEWPDNEAGPHDGANCYGAVLSRPYSSGRLVDVYSPVGKSIQNELLSQTGADALSRANRELREYKPDAAIRLRKVGIRDGRGR